MTAPEPLAVALARIRPIAERATEGPWTVHTEDLSGGRYFTINRPLHPGADPEDHEPIDIHSSDNGEADTSLIVEAVALVRDLLAGRISPDTTENGSG